MDNFTQINLEPKKAQLVQSKINVRKSLEMLSDRTTDYAEHHQHLINTYSDIIDVIDQAIKESETIGCGV
jgi:hypothetical protein